jgi:hypothetical protein
MHFSDSEKARWHPMLRRMHDYWLAKHPVTGLPGRKHISPHEFPDALPWVWMLDVHRDPLRFRYRLVGTGLVRMLKREPTGMWIDEAHPDFAATGQLDRYAEIVHQRAPQYRKGAPLFAHNQDFASVERLMLPLASDGNTVDILINTTIFFRKSGDPMV